eukprot:1870629-Pleurochrysis_carterae.AAC.1
MTVARVIPVGKPAASPARERLVDRVLARGVVVRGVRQPVHRVVRVGALGCVSPGHDDLSTEVVVSLFGAVTWR